MATTSYEIDYNDERFQNVEAEKAAALSDIEKTYSGLIDQSDAYYQQQIDAAKEWETKQSQLQQEQTDFTIEQVEQQKEQTQKDYLKEQSGAYVDWQKQSNEYGATAEAIAAQGLNKTGYSESSQVSMYNTYQNRLSTARESYNQAVLNYNNAIKEAQLQNSSALAEIAYQALQQQLSLSLEGFQYKNTLLLEQASKKLEVDEIYYQRYQDVLDQINLENALAEEIRQFNLQYAGSGSSGSSRSSGSSGGTTGAVINDSQATVTAPTANWTSVSKPVTSNVVKYVSGGASSLSKIGLATK